MSDKKSKTRIIHKHDTEENWNKAINFIPKHGEIIIYDSDDVHPTSRLKIGNGRDVVMNLPFITNESTLYNSIVFECGNSYI